MSAPELREAFLEFSSRVTAYTVVELESTGEVEAYLQTVVDVVGEDLVGDLLAIDVAIRRETHGDAAARDRLLRTWIFCDERFGPIARNIVKLWYLGTWYALPPQWHEAHGSGVADSTFVVCAAALGEGLAWPAARTSTPGAGKRGRAAWSPGHGPLPT